MTIALWCVLVGAFMPIICTGIAKAGAKDFDNSKPREWQQNLDGWRKRANAAQNNCFEAFPLFAAAVIVATMQGAGGQAVNLLALLWLAARGIYVWAYVADRPTLRSAVFSVAFFAAIAIFVSPLWA